MNLSKCTLFAILTLCACSTVDIQVDSSAASWSLPLVYGEIRVDDLVKKASAASQLFIQPDGSLLLRYTGDILEKTKKEIFSPIPGGIPIPLFDTLNLVTLPIVNNFVIKKAILSNTNYYVAYSHSRMEPVQVEFWLPEMQLNNKPLNLVLDIPYTGSVPVTGSSPKTSLEDIVMMPVNNKIGLHYQARTLNNVLFKLNSLFFYYDQLDFKYIEGYIGQNVYDLKKDSLEIDLYDGFSQGGIYIDDPKVTLTVYNSFGFPTKALINTFLMQTVSGTLIEFKSPLLDQGLYFNYPNKGEIGQTKATTYVFTKDNSNIKEVFNAQATRLIYDIDALSNPLLTNDSASFILDSSKFTINLTVELPLVGRISNYPAIQTFDANLDQLKNFKEGSLLIETDNAIPMSANAQIYLLNDASQTLDSLYSKSQLLFQSAATDVNGVSSKSTLYNVVVPVPSNKVVAWSQAKKIKVVAYFDTPADKNTVKINDRDRLRIKIGIAGKFK